MATNIPIKFYDELELNEYLDLFESLRTDKHYFYNGYPVPRTTEILSSMLHEQSLMLWSNRLGKYQRKDYEDYLNKAALIGTNVHLYNENFLKNGTLPKEGELPITIERYVLNAFHSFLKWWEYMNEKYRISILEIEKSMSCKYFGGTLDLLLLINNSRVLIDFKSSNHPSFKYFLQLASYRYMLREEYNIELDGCMVLMLNKNRIFYNILGLNFNQIEHLKFIDQCEETFLNLAKSYLQRIYIESKYSDIFQK